MRSTFEVVHRGERAGDDEAPDPRPPQRAQRAGRHRGRARPRDAVSEDPDAPWPASRACSAASRSAARAGGVLVVDDYGHHPAEIRATLAAAKAGFDRRVITVFQPHRYTRTQHLRDDFLTAFYQADVLIVMDIYAAGEAPIPGVHARDLADGIAAHGHREVLYLAAIGRPSSTTCANPPERVISCSLSGPATWASWAGNCSSGSATIPTRHPRGDNACWERSGARSDSRSRSASIPPCASEVRRTSSSSPRTWKTSAARCRSRSGSSSRSTSSAAATTCWSATAASAAWCSSSRAASAAPSSTARRRWRGRG